MSFSDVFHEAGLFALMTIVLGFAPLVPAVMYARRPTERTLALMRPISLAAIFGALSGVSSGFIAALRGVGIASEANPRTYSIMALGLSEALVPVFVCFGCLTIAWLLVALGMRRSA